MAPTVARIIFSISGTMFSLVSKPPRNPTTATYPPKARTDSACASVEARGAHADQDFARSRCRNLMFHHTQISDVGRARFHSAHGGVGPAHALTPDKDRGAAMPNATRG